MKKKFFLLIFILIILTGFAFATNYRIEGSTIASQFSTGELISGSLKISLFNQNNANFSSNLGGEISLLDFLEASNKIRGLDYNCIPNNCERTFQTITGTEGTLKEINLPTDNVYGFRLTGKEINIVEFSLKIEGVTGASCSNQLVMDLLNDGEINFFNSEYIDEVCSVKDWGCFQEGLTDRAIISTSKYCQKIKLPPAPAYNIGAVVIEGTRTGQLTMSLYDFENEIFLAKCEPEIGSGLIGCIAEYSSLEDFDAFVCIEAAAGTDYKIRTETNNPCGMTGVNPSADFEADYEIYSQAMKYGEINTTFDEENFEKLDPLGRTLVGDILQGYVDNTYGGDCDGEGCIIPFRIIGNSGSVTLKDLILRYWRGGTQIETDKIYELREITQKINASNLTLDISKMGFRTPNEEGVKDLKIYFDGVEIISEDINVSRSFEFDIEPKNVILKLATNFKILGVGNISNAVWKFGDGSLAKTGLNVDHVYSSAGSYDVEVELTDNRGQKSKRIFSINVRDAKTSAEILISKYKERLPLVIAQLDNFEIFNKEALERKLNFSNAQSNLQIIETKFGEAVNESQYVQILTDLLSMKIPENIAISLSGNLPFAVGFNNIKTMHLEEISEEKIGDSNALRNAIVSWYDSNYNANIAYEVISIYEEGVKEDILVKISLSLKSKNGDEESYLIIDYPLNKIEFKDDYAQESTISGTYLPIQAGFSGSRTFIVEDSISPSELGMYLSPVISKLTVVEDIGEPSKIPTTYPLGFLLSALGILIGLTLAGYIFLQEWYKRKYESYLFKNKDDLFNVINFISNGRKASLDDKKILDKLVKSGWNKEQIDYAFKKIDGKRTGMYEIPIFKFFEQMRIEKEIGKRGNDPNSPPIASQEKNNLEKNKYGPIDAKFIKRPKL